MKQLISINLNPKLIALVCSVAVVLALWFSDKTGIDPVSLLDMAQKVAFVMTGFIVAAFNLRFKMMDLQARSELSYSQHQKISGITLACTCRLTKMILYFILSAVFLVVAPVFGSLSFISGYIAGFAAILLLFGAAFFVDILFSFEQVEKKLVEVISKSKYKADKATRLAEMSGAPKDDS